VTTRGAKSPGQIVHGTPYLSEVRAVASVGLSSMATPTDRARTLQCDDLIATLREVAGYRKQQLMKEE
jgi:hypothetical protein